MVSIKIRTVVLSFIMLCVFFSCATKKPLGKIDYATLYDSKEYAIAKLRKEINEHGTIAAYPEGSPEIRRSGVSSLSNDKTLEINKYINNLNTEYPSRTDFVFINYYPGEDDCNSTGLATRSSIGRDIDRFNKEIDRRAEITQLSIAKDTEGINRWNKGRNFLTDDQSVITDTFFPDHYPCSSYLILHKSGKYYYYYGESWTEKKLQDIDLFIVAVLGGSI